MIQQSLLESEDGLQITTTITDIEQRTLGIVDLISAYAYASLAESSLQLAITMLLEENGHVVRREFTASAKDRFDLWVDDAIVIETKTQGSLPTAMIQCDRYAGLQVVRGIILVGSKLWARHAGAGRQEIRGKPLYVVYAKPRAF